LIGDAFGRVPQLAPACKSGSGSGRCSFLLLMMLAEERPQSAQQFKLVAQAFRDWIGDNSYFEFH
jgi:hypothetical protein